MLTDLVLTCSHMSRFHLMDPEPVSYIQVAPGHSMIVYDYICKIGI